MRAVVLVWTSAAVLLGLLGGCGVPACDIHGDQTAIGAAILLDGQQIGTLDAIPSRRSCGARVRIPRGNRHLTFVSVQGESVGVEFNSEYNTPLFVTFHGHEGKPQVDIGPEGGS